MTFTFKIKIDGSSKPPIWRKVKVNSTISFDDFHLAIQVLFGWRNYHMYQFSPSGWRSTPCIMYIYEDDAEVEIRPLSDPDTFPYGERYDAEKLNWKTISDNSNKKWCIYMILAMIGNIPLY